MKLAIRAALALLVLFLAACATHAPRPDSNPPLILVSIDGFRADYFERGLSPNLKAIADAGVHAAAMRPAFPTLTFPNHYTLVTGLYPDHHGIVNNTMVDPVLGNFTYKKSSELSARWWEGAEPLWVTADKQGVRTATMFWPGSDVEIRGHRPDYYLPFNGKMTAGQRIDQVLAWLDQPAAKRPRFLTLYFEQLDHESHDHGPGSTEADAALREVDASIGHLVAELEKRDLYKNANLVIVSDHGMAETDAERTVILDSIVDLRHIDLVTSGIAVGINPKPGYEAEVERAMLAPRGHMQCWRKGELPARLHYGTHPRIPALVCVPESGWLIETQEFHSRPNHRMHGGEHGYDNDDPHMRALFLAHGPAFKRGLSVPEFDNVDVYPLLAHLLDIRPEPNDGNPATMREMLQ
ncbi:ectonucleotide pyrophosphatase/phosphodiesterase [Rudaea cellulosilytica]|uniref:alkaline phosphatase family protein n=1 Tax=Rudaea cellulosilytica TaxID=540746 RepID=UPI0003675A07|nr:ectonucleotide pyrophosphatase/phosphodiesterase [Rudaea cellulosilytica]